MSTSHVWPLALYFAAILALVGIMLGLSAVLGQQHATKAANQPFESGVVGIGSARLRFPAQFYLVAMIFVVFDLEAVYLFAWGIALRDAGWPGYAGALVFIGALLVALAYLWRLGALDWGPASRRRARTPVRVGR